MSRPGALLWVATVLLVLLSTVISVGRDLWSDVVLYAVLPLNLATVGALVLSHNRGNRIGWIFSALGLYIAVAEVGEGYGLLAADWGLQGADLGTWLITWSWVGEIVAWTVIAAVFPDGRLAARRWRWVLWFAGVGFMLATIGFALGPDSNSYFQGGLNPFLVDHVVIRAVQLGGVLLIVASLIGAAVSLVQRLRRARGVERQQLKWFALAASLTALLAPVVIALWQRTPVVAVVGALMFNALPVATGIAILRYRLYNIDIVIKRTLVYSTLTVALVATYLVLVLVLQVLLLPLAGDSDLAVAASTLTVAALFRPLRAAIQGVVDRRFFRSRYDAARALEDFSATLRSELDLDTLGTDLRSVVHDTMQPEHVSLWLRTSGTER